MINPYWELIILLCLINIIFALSLNLILGYNGQFSLGHAAFLAIGAYASGSVTASFGLPLWAGVLIAITLSMIAAVLIGYPCFRLRGDYLAIATLGFAEIVRIIVNTLPKEYFGGPTGMTNVDNLSSYISLPQSFNGLGNLIFTLLFSLIAIVLLAWVAFALTSIIAEHLNRWKKWKFWQIFMIGFFILVMIFLHRPLSSIFMQVFQYQYTLNRVSFDSEQWILFLIYTALVAVITWLLINYLNSNYGRSVISIREDEIAATNLGINCTWVKLQNFVIGAAIAGLAGAMLAHTLPLFKPTNFDFFKSVDVLLIVVLGGMGTITGSFVGATVITLLLEALRFLGQWRLVLYSLVLILFMIFRPGGLLGNIELHSALKLQWQRLININQKNRSRGRA